MDARGSAHDDLDLSDCGSRCRGTASGELAIPLSCANRPAPIFIVCSPSRQVGKTLFARLLNDYYVAEGRAVAAFDLADEGPRLADYVTDASIVDIGDIRGQIAFFDGLIGDNEIVKVIDVGYREFKNFFSVVQTIGLFEEARRRTIEFVLLFMIDPMPKTLRVYDTLRRLFTGVPLLPVRNQMVSDSLCNSAFRQAGKLAASLEIPTLGSSAKSFIDCKGFSFVEACSNAPLLRSEYELQKWIRSMRYQFRELELALIGRQILAAIQSPGGTAQDHTGRLTP